MNVRNKLVYWLCLVAATCLAIVGFVIYEIVKEALGK